MKIAIIGSDSFDSLEFHLKDELDFQGNQTRIFGYSSLFSKKVEFGLNKFSYKYNVFQNKKLLEKILNFKPELVIGVYRTIHPLVVKAIKNNGIKIIHINPDQMTTLGRQEIFAESYDIYFTKDPYMESFIKEKLNLNVFRYNEAFNPRVHKKPNVKAKELEKEVDIDVLTFGNLYPYRNRMLKILKDKNITLSIYGNKTKYFDSRLNSIFRGKGIYGLEKTRILNGSKIVFNNFHYAEIESVNNKFFEINGCGGFQICDYKPILNSLLPFDPKKVSFRNIDEAERLITFYLKSPEKRYELRDKTYKHFLENFTYEKMLDNILNKL